MHRALAWLPALALRLALGLALGLGPAVAQAQQAVPALSGRVIDQTGTLSASEREALGAKLAAFESERGTQIVVLMVQETAPEDIAAYAQRVADTWKIGRLQVGDGVLVVAALRERRARIEVAKALEGAIPDLAARQILDQHLRPAFREGAYARGLDATVQALMARVRGDADIPVPTAPGTREGAEPGFQLEEIAVFMFFAIPIVGAVLTGILGRKLGTLATAGAAGYGAWWFSASLFMAALAGIAALVLVGVIGFGSSPGRRMRRGGGLPHIGTWGGGGWSGGSISSSDGGGFSSGGGGDFGGGGASGDW
jgi:uncharacterized protein